MGILDRVKVQTTRTAAAWRELLCLGTRRQVGSSAAGSSDDAGEVSYGGLANQSEVCGEGVPGDLPDAVANDATGAGCVAVHRVYDPSPNLYR